MTPPHTRSGQPCSPYAVLAHHRSGSNFLNDLLQAHPQVECINEPLSMHTSFFRACDLVHWSGGDYHPEQLHPSLTAHGGLRDFLQEFRQYLLQSTGERVIGFKETVLFGKLEWLQAFLPTLKLVFLKRDPCAIVASVLRSRLFPFWNYSYLVPPAFHRLHPGYTPRADRSDPLIQTAEIAAMSVVVRHTMARQALGRFTHLELDLADLMQDPVRELQSLSAFLGVQPNPRQLEFLARRQAETRGGTFSSFRSREDVEHGWKRQLDVRQVQVIEEVMQCARVI